MTRFKDFTGKTLDEAIENALAAFGVPREKLEIEIVSGGSNGIFGLMSKKAVVKARLRPRLTDHALDGAGNAAPPKAPQEPAARPEPRPAQPQAPVQAPAPQAKAQSAPPEPPAAPAAGPGQAPGRPLPAPARVARPEPAARPQARPAPRQQPEPDLDDAFDDDLMDQGAGAPRVAPEDEPDPATLAAVVREVVQSVLTPIIGPTELEVSAEPGRVKVLIHDEENSGLIIGREGQTIAALQYIVNRIVARRLPTSARVHLDAGDYRQRQDDNLQRMALYLADKAKNQNRTQSTKPLSSYHRRLVHLALQDDESIVTSSKGDGPLKRVLIHPRKGGQQRHPA
ncbi:RNA-binding cell elongation regulator Jag/EloR [Desulfocurvus vexinensis]|uniref:RNA-binding cell elongation regulator Jag/EloR n=1 Tax=Desulfocurvus vexinensis TaxID=399548 RepID=UPI00048A53DA|nr:RNA-binding cell elongation regulator Jag/EloR [Desulfocurvus vexinensis]